MVAEDKIQWQAFNRHGDEPSVMKKNFLAISSAHIMLYFNFVS
jgi:hypothetical protein